MFRQSVFAAGSDESRNVKAALVAAAIDFTPVLRPVFVENPEALGGIEAVEGRFAVQHPTTGRTFEVVGSGYEPVGASEALNWIQPLVDAGQAEIISAGSTGGGSRVYVQARLTDSEVDVVRGDSIFASVNFATGHDGTLPACAGTSSTRVVCQNTMAMMIRSLLFRARHTKNVRDILAAAAIEFAAHRKLTRDQADSFRRMARRKLDDKALVRYVRETLSPGAGQDAEITVRGVDRIVELAHEAPGATPGTLWGGLNAVTYWATHERGRSDDARVDANMFGKGTQLIGRAIEVATVFAEHLPLNDLARESYSNHATASAELNLLLGKPARLPFEQAAE